MLILAKRLAANNAGLFCVWMMVLPFQIDLTLRQCCFIIV